MQTVMPVTTDIILYTFFCNQLYILSIKIMKTKFIAM